MKLAPLALVFAIISFFTGCQSPDKKSTASTQAQATVPDNNGDFIQKISPDIGINFKHFQKLVI